MSDDGIYLMGHRNWKTWRHSDSGGDIVPFGIFAIEDNEIRSDMNVFVGGMPAADSKAYAVNGPKTCTATNKVSIYQTGFEIILQYEGDEPAIGDKYGPKSGQSTAVKDGTPALWECMGTMDATNKVMRARWIGSPSLTPAILKTDCAPGDTDLEAWPVKSDGTADTDADPITLSNTHPGSYRGYGTEHDLFYGANELAAKILYASINGGDQIVCGQAFAMHCRATTTSAVTMDQDTFEVDNVRVMEPGAQWPCKYLSDTLTVKNDGARIGSDVRGTIIWDETIEGYRYLDFPWICEDEGSI